MIEVLEWIFSDWWKFLGVLILLNSLRGMFSSNNKN